MSINLADYAEMLEGLSEHTRNVLEANWHEATKVFSPRGLDNYLKAVSAIRGLGRGDSLVETWIEEAPRVAKEVGEDVVGDLATAALMMASKTSGTVIEMLLASAPVAANRLGDSQLFLNYLQFINTLLAQAPRGVRPMLEKLETLFQHLTLGGLRRWALWGAHAHRTNYEEQIKYFSLDTKESMAMLQKERKGTLLVDVQRRINMYLRALWARDFFMRPTSGDFESREGYRPYIEDYLLHLPDAYDDFIPPAGGRSAPPPPVGEGSGEGKSVQPSTAAPSPGAARHPLPQAGEGMKIPGLELYRATAAHCAAHVVETKFPISAEALNPLQMAMISVIEDARVETLSIRRFPGLKALWGQFHTATPAMSATVGDYLNRLARALLDDAYQDTDPWIAEGRALFAAAKDKLDSNTTSWEIGVQLAHSFGQKKIAFNPRTDLLTAPYRDDNRYFWAFEEFDFDKAASAGYESIKQVRKYVNVMEMANEIDVETAGDDAEEIWVLGTELFPYENIGDQYGGEKSFNETEGKEPMSDPFHYSEWDYQIQLERPAWATVLEKRARSGDLQVINDIAAQYKREIHRMKFLLDAMQPQGVQRIRKLEDGDEIDINAAINSFTDIRLGSQPDPRIMMRSVRKTRDFSILVLLDLSESTNEKVQGQDYSVMDLTRQACVLLSDAISKVGDPFAIHGFCSDGRHNVEYYCYKDFDQNWDETPKGKLAGMTGQLSTRMGAAIRHAGHHLKLQRSAKKLLIVITDGEPADVDVRDPQYLRYDTKKAVEEVAKNGVITYCMSLDPRADNYVSRIFGPKNYMVVDHVETLPQKLPLLYAGLTR